MWTDALMAVVFLGVCVWVLARQSRRWQPVKVLKGLVRGVEADPFTRLAVSAHQVHILEMSIRLEGEGIESYEDLDEPRAYGFSTLSNNNQLYVRESQFDRARDVLIQAGFGEYLVPPVKRVDRADGETRDSSV